MFKPGEGEFCYNPDSVKIMSQFSIILKVNSIRESELVAQSVGISGYE